MSQSLFTWGDEQLYFFRVLFPACHPENRGTQQPGLCVCVCDCLCVCVCVTACMHACVRICMCVSVLESVCVYVRAHV